MNSDRSTLSSKSRHLLENSSTMGTHKIKYQSESDWDYHFDAGQAPTDLSLILPHYRARHQPVDHRMSMCIAGESKHIKLKICRTFPTSKFYLEVLSIDGDVTVWVPSDFKGQIHHPGKATFSPGFSNHISRNARINDAPSDRQTYSSSYSHLSCNQNRGEDEIVVVSRGHITFRMWDVQKRTTENTHKESLKRILGISRKAPEAAIDWDCLLRD